MIGYYYGDVDEHGRLVEHVTVARDAYITPEDLAKVRGIGSTVHMLATGVKWLYTASGWTIDNTPEGGGGGGGGPEPYTLSLNQQATSNSAYHYEAPFHALVYMINNGLLDTSQLVAVNGLLAGVYTEAAPLVPDLSKIDLSAATSMINFLAGNDLTQAGTTSVFSLAGLDDTSGVTNIQGLFQDCQTIQTINLAELDTSAVMNFSLMFKNCKSLTSVIGLADMDTHQATTMADMFADCHLLAADVSAFDISNVTTLADMFRVLTSGDGAKVIKAPAVDNRTLAKATNAMFGSQGSYIAVMTTEIYAPKCRSNNIQNMFSYCTHMHTLHLDGCDMSETTRTNNAWLGCTALTTITTDEQTVMPVIAFTMADCPLTEQSAVNVFNALPTVSAARTVTLSAQTKALLTEADIAIATDKGWTIA